MKLSEILYQYALETSQTANTKKTAADFLAKLRINDEKVKTIKNLKQ